MDEVNPAARVSRPASPSYSSLFSGDLLGRSSPQQLDASDGPLAYLSDLYQTALQLEKSNAEDGAILLETRRPELGGLMLDQSSLNQAVPALTLVIEALTRQAAPYAGEGPTRLAEAVAKARYPAGLPYHAAQQQALAVLKQKNVPIFDLLQQVGGDFPNFCYGALRTPELRAAMLVGSVLAPDLQALLLDVGASSATNFLATQFGMADGVNALNELLGVDCFLRQTGLGIDQLQALLVVDAPQYDGAVVSHSPVRRSVCLPAVSGTSAPEAGEVYGAVFINNASGPAVCLAGQAGNAATLNIQNANAATLYRMHKIIHLQRALQLPFAEVDLLVMSALRAEGQVADFHFTANTLRTLGVFRHFNQQLGIAAEQFAALISGVSAYAVGDAVPFLDRLLAPASDGAEGAAALLLDGRAFELAPGAADTASRAIIARLCRALGTDERTGSSLLAAICAAQGLAKPTCSLEVVSALYRLARLRHLLKLSTSETGSLVALVGRGNAALLKQLAGKPSIKDGDDLDILDVLVALLNTSQWLIHQKLPAHVLNTCLNPAPTNAQRGLAAPAAWKAAIEEKAEALHQALLTEGQVAARLNGFNARPGGADRRWLPLLGAFVDANGLIKPPSTLETSVPAQITAALTAKLAGDQTAQESAAELVQIAEALAGLFQDRAVAQQDVATALALRAFKSPGQSVASRGAQLEEQHVLPLLRWVGHTSHGFLVDALAWCDAASAAATSETAFGDAAFDRWYALLRRAQIVTLFNLSPTGLVYVLDHPEWLDSEDSLALPSLTLDFCYQLSRYSEWLARALEVGKQEADVLGYLGKANSTTTPWTEQQAAADLGGLLNWPPEEVLYAVRAFQLKDAGPVPTRMLQTGGRVRKTFNDFILTLTPTVRRYYASRMDLHWIATFYQSPYLSNYEQPSQVFMAALFAFIDKNPMPLLVPDDQYAVATNKPIPARTETNGRAPLQLEKYTPVPFTVAERLALTAGNEGLPAIANTISEVDFVLRLQSLSRRTGLSAQTLLNLPILDSAASYGSWQAWSALLFAGCSEEERAAVDPALNEAWRDALVAYLLGQGIGSDAADSASRLIDAEDLSNYLLMDVQVAGSVLTTRIGQAATGLQHYLHRQFAGLEAGYNLGDIPDDTREAWHAYLNQYALWKTRQQQMNHPENIIYPRLRPGKSQPFIELENELNQGKLTADMVQIGVTNYLSKFEQVSNLQVVSGYLDGYDPEQDTYHFIGKTNVEPAEYYWRTLDMGMRDDKQQLSPLAWGEWEKINLPSSGQIVSTLFTIKEAGKADVVNSTDAVRPIIIAGRPYVIWVERDHSPLPSADETNQTPTKYRRLRVCYAYQQSDGLWSSANELICLDGTQDGKRQRDDLKNPFLKDSTYQPGLMAVVNIEKDREADPWLAVMLYDASKPTLGDIDKDYFLEMRDLLLLDRKDLDADDPAVIAALAELAAVPATATPAVRNAVALRATTVAALKPKRTTFVEVLYNSFSNPRVVQHIYTGERLVIIPIRKAMRVFLPSVTVATTAGLSSESWAGVLPMDTKLTEAMVFSRLNASDVGHRFRLLKAYFVASSRRELYPPALDCIFPSEQKFKEFLKRYSDLIETIRKPRLLGTQDYEAINPLYTLRSIYWEKAPARRDLAGHVVFEKEAFYTFNVNVNNVQPEVPKLSIKANYPLAVVKDSAKSVKDIRFEWGEEITETRCKFEIKEDQSLTGLVDNIKFELSFEASERISAEPLGVVFHLTNGQDMVFLGIPVLIINGAKSKKSYSLKNSVSLKRLGNVSRISVVTEILDNAAMNDELIKLGDLVVSFRPEDCAQIKLKLLAKAPGATIFTELVEKTVTADGTAFVEVTDYPYSGHGDYTFVLAESGNPDINGAAIYSIPSGTDSVWSTQIQRNKEQAQYLDLSGLGVAGDRLPFKVLRLNTLFGKQLVARATESFERVLAWDSQQLLEPAIEAGKVPSPMDFHGANGRYFRELFLHLPYLVATRLSEEQQFREAQLWCTRYLFDPFRPSAGEQNQPAFWNARPLAELGTGTSLLKGFIDPALRAFTSSRYYRRAVFLFLVEHWQREGDHFYRQLTPGSLTQAWLCYQQALKLIGPLPTGAGSASWNPLKLESVTETTFRLPINARLEALQRSLKARLYNLRHGLTIDGKLRPFEPLGASANEPFNPATGTAGWLAGSANSGLLEIPHYRFRALLPMARSAVSTLAAMGHRLMACLESEDGASEALMLQAQQIQLSQFTIRLQEEAVNSALAGQRTLELSKEAAVQRHDYYVELCNEGLSDLEMASAAASVTAAVLEVGAAPFSVAEGLMDAVPNIFGLAVGGQKYAGPVNAIIAGMHAASLASQYLADHLALQADYQRRAQDWTFQVNQTSLEVQTIQQQMLEQKILITCAEIGLEEAQAIRGTLEETYADMTDGFTTLPTYNWMVARMTTLYAPAYDAVLSLCLATEAAWRYETGDYQQRGFIRPSAWDDGFKGMLAGESLQLDLQEMEVAYLQSNERRMNIKKTISLKKLLGLDDAQWLKKLKELATKPLNFELTEKEFDRNYPGHYRRQLKHVSVTFDMAADATKPLTDMCAVLTQASSSTLVVADTPGLEYLYGKGPVTPSVIRNCRALQQVALSSTVADDGRGIGTEGWMCSLFFDDGRFLPFEGTGAVSNWLLSFPDASLAGRLYSGTKPVVTDILIHVVYTALDGGSQFAAAVRKQVADSDAAAG